jgi:AcrR family transcriptional regulator
VLDAAHALLAELGPGALTMRALARRLDVAPNALYSHVDSKTALLDDLLDDLLAAVSVPDPAAPDPSAAVARMMEASYAVLTAHPDLVPMFLSRQGARGPNAVRLGEVLDQLLVHAGVAEADVAEARRVLIVHAIGSAAFATGAPVEPEGDRPLPPAESQRTFARSLQWLLAGILLGGPAGRPPEG